MLDTILDFSCECFQAAGTIARPGKRDRYARAADVGAKLSDRGLRREQIDFTPIFRVVDAHGGEHFKGTIEQIGVWVDSRPSTGRLVREVA